MSNWTYVTIAYTAVWGALAVYALLLARRVAQAREVSRKLSEAIEAEPQSLEQDGAVCDAPPAP